MCLAHIDINAVSGLAYEYTLTIDGKSLKKFLENKEKTSRAWTLKIAGTDTRIVLGMSILFFYFMSLLDFFIIINFNTKVYYLLIKFIEPDFN